MDMKITQETWPLRGVFRIARGSRTHASVVTVTLNKDGATGLGECVPYARYDESADSVAAQLESIRPQVEMGIDIVTAQSLLPAFLTVRAGRQCRVAPGSV